MKQLLIDLFVGFVCLFLCFFQGAAEGGMVELAAVGLPPPEQGNSVFFFDYLSSVFLSFSLKDTYIHTYFITTSPKRIFRGNTVKIKKIIINK